MVGGHHVVEHAQAEALLGFEKPLEITTPVSAKLQQKSFLVAPVGNVPNVTWDVMPIRPWHPMVPFLEGPFAHQKQHPKPENRPILQQLTHHLK